jgi:hypothetical protein
MQNSLLKWGKAVDQENYKYDSLSGHDEIRLLVLHPGTGPLSCRLLTEKLADNPRFEAISYVWGSSEKDHDIVCNGHRLKITASLHGALSRTRSRWSKRVLWADSICINQNDNREKAHQVSLMGHIYTQADTVLICLPSVDDNHSQSAASLVADVDRMFEATLEKIGNNWDSFPQPEQDDPLLSDPRWESLGYLTRLPWFTRGWVVQEAGLAAKAEVLWGDSKIDWMKLTRAYHWMDRRADQIGTDQKIYLPGLYMDLYSVRCKNEAMTLFPEPEYYTYNLIDILDSARKLGLYDQRDHIYAFLGLPGAADFRKNIAISYEKSYHDVYQDFATQYLNKTKRLDLLNYVEHNDITISTEVPSWIPQWCSIIYLTDVRYPSNSRIIPQSFSASPLLQIDANTLKVRGFIMDSVSFKPDRLTKETSIADMAAIWTAFQKHRDDTVYKSFSPLLAILHTITLGRYGHSYEAGNLMAHEAAYMLLLHGNNALPNDQSLDAFRNISRQGDANNLQTHARNAFTIAVLS